MIRAKRLESAILRKDGEKLERWLLIVDSRARPDGESGRHRERGGQPWTEPRRADVLIAIEPSAAGEVQSPREVMRHLRVRTRLRCGEALVDPERVHAGLPRVSTVEPERGGAVVLYLKLLYARTKLERARRGGCQGGVVLDGRFRLSRVRPIDERAGLDDFFGRCSSRWHTVPNQIFN